jgi:hypothetical protein
MIDPGLCATCAFAKVMTSDRGSTFLRCTHPDLPKYPRLPVLACDKYTAKGDIPPG